jgi:hypothetical protein
MALKLTVGLSKKLGLPNFSSLGASCHVEIELDQSLLFHDLDGFHERAKSAFIACRQAVVDELCRQRSSDDTPDHGDELSDDSIAKKPAGHEWSPPPPTAKQMDYARKLAGQIRGLGAGRLDAHCERTLGKPLAELTGAEASELIDALKDMKSRRAPLGEAEKGVAA